MITLSNVLAVWLKKKGRINGKKFFIDDCHRTYDIIRCKTCTCFAVFVDIPFAMLHLRLDPRGYDHLKAIDQQFFPKLEKHLSEHICG